MYLFPFIKQFLRNIFFIFFDIVFVLCSCVRDSRLVPNTTVKYFAKNPRRKLGSRLVAPIHIVIILLSIRLWELRRISHRLHSLITNLEYRRCTLNTRYSLQNCIVAYILVNNLVVGFVRRQYVILQRKRIQRSKATFTRSAGHLSRRFREEQTPANAIFHT